MSIEAMTWALNADVGDPTRKLVLIGYANHAHKDGRNAWASKDTIAEYVNCSAKTVRRHVLALIAGGWLRSGDQAQVAHLRADRRPVVYDLAMTDAVRETWRTEAAVEALAVPDMEPNETDSPAPDPDRGDNLTPRQTGRGGTHGGSPVSERGDKAVSPEPSRTKEQPPHPPASGGSCARPGPTPHPNCRGCGTTNRQLADARRREAEEGRRRLEQDRRRLERAAAAATRRPTEDRPPSIAAALAGVRLNLGARRTTTPDTPVRSTR